MESTTGATVRRITRAQRCLLQVQHQASALARLRDIDTPDVALIQFHKRLAQGVANAWQVYGNPGGRLDGETDRRRSQWFGHFYPNHFTASLLGP